MSYNIFGTIQKNLGQETNRKLLRLISKEYNRNSAKSQFENVSEKFQ